MTPMILENFKNIVGHHCSSSAVRSVAAYDNIQLSEAMCFGLGSGLGFFYSIEEDTNSESLPSRRLNGRAPNLEGNFFDLIEQPLDWFEVWESQHIVDALNLNRPIIAQTDIFSIPYYDDVHFTGHGLLVVGLEGEKIYTADIAAAGFSTMSLNEFKASLNYELAPMQQKYHYAVVPKIEAIQNYDEKVLQALAKTVLYMLEPPSSFEGIAGLLALAHDLPTWQNLPDRSWVARFAYQSLEKRGTGGGNFRPLFTDFLVENQNYLAIEDDVLVGFRDVAMLWTKLAQTFKSVAFEESEEVVTELLKQAQHKVELLAVSEQQLFEHLYYLISRKIQ